VGLVVTPVTAGAAHAALADAVRDAKSGRPLRPVTVLVPTNAAGVMARRRLGRDVGVAAVDVVTLYRLAERLAGPALRGEGRLPVSTAVVDLAVRAVLAEHRTAFDEVADHPSTVVALRDLHRELRMAGPAALIRLQQASRRGRDAAHVSRLVADRLAERWYDEGDLLQRAIDVVAAGGLPDALGRVVVFLPQSLGQLDVQLLRALGEQGHVTVLLGLTGERQADRDLVTVATALTGSAPPPAVAGVRAHTEIVSVTDADEEVRHAVRVVIDTAREGTPLGRIAIVWPTDRPYARLVEHHLGVAGIEWNGRPGTNVSERAVPRFLLDLLDVDRRGLRRRDLFDLLADLPLRDGTGRPVPTAMWERVSRDAGIVADEHWTPRLRSYATWQRRRAEEHRAGDDDERPEPAGEVICATADAAESLLAFVDELRRDLGPRHATRTWAEWAGWAVDQIERRLGADAPHRSPHAHGDAEYQAYEHTTRVLDRLRHLDAVGPPATRSEFRAVFAAEFDVAPGRLGRIGNGVTIGSLTGAAGLDADLVVVLGAADGILPAAPTIDPLVGDAERRAAGLPTSDAVAARAHRQFLGLLDSAARVVVTSPRGDLRASTTRQPSRWLGPLDQLAGHPVPMRMLASHASALLHVPFPAHAAEHRLRGRSALVAAAGPDAIGTVAGDTALARSLALRTARRADGLTAFDGDLSTVRVPRLDTAVSATQLQAWTVCPHAYFVQYLLGVRATEEPGDEITITSADRGSVLHEVLDQFHHEVIAGDLPQPGPHGWDDRHVERLMVLFEETCDRWERAGRTGRPATWSIQRQNLQVELLDWVVHDSHHVHRRRAQVIASELRFGDDGAVALALPGGRRLAVRGGGRPRRPHADRSRRHRPQDRQGRLVPRDRRRLAHRRTAPLPAARLRRRRAPARGRHVAAGAGRVRVLPCRQVPTHRVRAARRGVGTCRCRPRPRGRRHRGRLVPERPGEAGLPALRRLPLLPTRRARHRGAVARVEPQAARPPARPLVRRAGRRRRHACRHRHG
jgi:ATP-dependent helicase/nuclease subunit B